MLNHDIYSKEELLVSIDNLAPELLYHLAEITTHDQTLEDLKGALEFAVQFLTDREMELLFFRFLHGDSYKTLKKTVRVGSTKTAAKRTRKLKQCIKEYVYYYFEQDYESDLKFIEGRLGKDARAIADLLFRRMSRNAILQSRKLHIGQGRLARIIVDIEILCLSSLRMSGFWEVLITVGKIKYKKV